MKDPKRDGLQTNPGTEQISPVHPSTVSSKNHGFGAPEEEIGLAGTTEKKPVQDLEVFGDEGDAAIRYRTLSWPMVAVLMIAEIVSNGMLSLPATFAVVGIVPGVIVLVFLGLFEVLHIEPPSS